MPWANQVSKSGVGLLYWVEDLVESATVEVLSVSSGEAAHAVVLERKRQTQIEDVTVVRKTVRPGDTIPLILTFASEGKRFTRTVPYTVPKGFSPGTLQFTASDALIANFNEFRLSIMSPPRSAAAVVKLLQSLRDNTKAYIRVWRAEPSYQSQGEDLPSPPPSAAMVLGRSQGAGSIGVGYSSKITELSVPLGDVMVSGTHTVSVEVKE